MGILLSQMNRTNYGILFYLLQEVHNLYELFHTRNNLFRRAYFHKVAKAVEYMYVYNYVNLGISINISYRCQPTNLPIRAQKKFILKQTSSFHYVVLWKLLNRME